jgi:hypothetical protein
MKRIYITVAMAASLTAATAAGAQQVQSFGRDSVYAVPGATTRPSAPTVAAPINRFGRDSVYVTQTPNAPPSTPVGYAKGLQQYGRDSTYANGSPNPPAATSGESAAGSTVPGHGG